MLVKQGKLGQGQIMVSLQGILHVEPRGSLEGTSGEGGRGEVLRKLENYSALIMKNKIVFLPFKSQQG
jgi:hypothetical protein